MSVGVLIVDDQEPFRSAARMVVEMADGFEVIGEAEVLEIVVKEGSPADGSTIADLNLPKEVLIGAIVRDGKAQIARGRSVLRSRDHLVIFAMPHALDDATHLFG